MRRLFGLTRAYLDRLDRHQFAFCPDLACWCCDYGDGPCRRWQGRE